MSANSAIAYADASASDAARARWHDHLADCGVCRQLVAALAGGGLEGRRDAVAALGPGDGVGRFELIEVLGSGGFGVVYRARDPQLGRDVALKLWRVHALHPTSAEEGALRVLAEARALAQLSHPNVMSVYEVGQEGEQVFLAGELIEGKSLAQLIDEGVSPQRVLALFEEVAEGLIAAHDAGLIHRDVKPDNILVGDDGRARLVDFGLARGLSDNDLSASSPAAENLRETLTLTGSLVGTPAYMAPEQFNGADADTRSDQYALCVSLFEALTGERPVRGANLDELRRHCLEGRRRPLPSSLPAQARRVLERGLALDPSARYPDLRELVRDLRRDRLRPFRRGAIAVGLLALGAAATALLWKTPPTLAEHPGCRHQHSWLRDVWDPSTRQAVETAFLAQQGSIASESFARVAERFDSYSQAWVAMREETCRATYERGQQSESLFARRMLCLDRRLGELKSLVSSMSTADQALVERGPRAITQLVPLQECADVESMSLLEPLPSDPARRKTAEDISARLAKVEGLRMAGKYDQALAEAQEAATIAVELDYAPLVAEAHYEVGFLWSYKNEAKQAAAPLEQAHHEAMAARSFRLAARAAVELVMVYGEMVLDPDKAAQWARHAKSSIAAHGSDALLDSNLANNQGQAAAAAGDYDKALAFHNEALRLRRKLYGPRDRSVAQSLNNLGIVRQTVGDTAGAAELFGQAHEIFAHALGAHHPYVGLTANNLGTLALGLGQASEAEKRFREALAIATDAQGADSPAALMARFNLATAMDESGRPESARGELEDVLADYQRLFPNEREAIARVTNSLGVVASKTNEFARASEFFGRALALRVELHGEEHNDTLLVRLNLALVLGRDGQLEAALAEAERCVRGFEALFGRKHPLVARSLMARGEQLIHLGRSGEAVDGLAEALAMLEEFESDPETLADARYNYGRALWPTRPRLGEREVRQALATYRGLGVRGAEGAREAEQWLAARGLTEADEH